MDNIEEIKKILERAWNEITHGACRIDIEEFAHLIDRVYSQPLEPQENIEQIIISAMTNGGEYQVEDAGEHATEIARALIFNGYGKLPQPLDDKELRIALAKLILWQRWDNEYDFERNEPDYNQMEEAWEDTTDDTQNAYLKWADCIILALLSPKIEEAKREERERIERKMCRATTAHILRGYRWIFEDDWQALKGEPK